MWSKWEEFPSPTEPDPDKASCQMFCWYDVRNVSHGSDTVKCCQSRADLCRIFAQSLVGRVCRFCGGLFTSWRLSHTQSPRGQVACNPSCVSARQVADRRRGFSVRSVHGSGEILMMSVNNWLTMIYRSLFPQMQPVVMYEDWGLCWEMAFPAPGWSPSCSIFSNSNFGLQLYYKPSNVN